VASGVAPPPVRWPSAPSAAQPKSADGRSAVPPGRVGTPPPAPPRPWQAETVQPKLSVTWSKSAKAYQIGGRPDFTAALKRDIYGEADDDGEDYIVKFSSNDGLSFQFPSVHRRHKLAWSLWRAAVNAVLANGDESDMEGLMSRCFVSSQWKTWSKKEFTAAWRDGNYLTSMANDFFNHRDNLWLGPGDENMGKGGGLDKLIKAYVSNPNKKNRAALMGSAFDPHNKNEFEYREPDTSKGESGGWYYFNVPQTPRSEEMETTTNYILDYLK
jgi:hypothetical protein